jgi:hypothetical protein
MKKNFLIVAIYLTGCFFAYKYSKFNLLNNNYYKEWTKGDRTFSIMLSSGSWLTVIADGIIHGIGTTNTITHKKNDMIVTPQQMEGNLSKLDEALLKFEQKFNQQEKGQNYYHIVISGEYDRKVLDEVARLYESAGWSVKACRTSSENGERGGLTGLQLERK